VLNKDNGLISYPCVGAQNNVRIKCQFNPGISYYSQVRIESTIENANAIWQVYQVTHDLSSQTDGGPWETNFEAFRPGTTTEPVTR
jgi:hypothetical protein